MQIPLWKRVLIVAVCLIALFFAMPNLFYTRVELHNDAVTKIAKTGVTTPELAAAQAGWPDWLPSSIVNLGLDLRGGAHLLAEVQVARCLCRPDERAVARGARRAAQGRATQSAGCGASSRRRAC